MSPPQVALNSYLRRNSLGGLAGIRIFEVRTNFDGDSDSSF